MLDKNIIIKSLEEDIRLGEYAEGNCQYIDIDVLIRTVELLKDSEIIVRCKDCVYGLPTGASSLRQCAKPYSGTPLYDINYYCADGKRK